MPKISAIHKTGFRIEFDDVGRDRIDEAVEWLLAHDYRPDVSRGDPWQRTPDGSPICIRHRIAMTKRERQGDSWWSHPIAHPETTEVRYCRGYPHASKAGDGFEL